jgi:hypothetical protein
VTISNVDKPQQGSRVRLQPKQEALLEYRNAGEGQSAALQTANERNSQPTTVEIFQRPAGNDVLHERAGTEEEQHRETLHASSVARQEGSPHTTDSVVASPSEMPDVGPNEENQDSEGPEGEQPANIKKRSGGYAAHAGCIVAGVPPLKIDLSFDMKIDSGKYPRAILGPFYHSPMFIETASGIHYSDCCIFLTWQKFLFFSSSEKLFSAMEVRSHRISAVFLEHLMSLLLTASRLSVCIASFGPVYGQYLSPPLYPVAWGSAMTWLRNVLILRIAADRQSWRARSTIPILCRRFHGSATFLLILEL